MAVAVLCVLYTSSVQSFRIGHPPSAGNGGFDSEASTGFATSEESAHDFVAHFFSASHLGVIFSAKLKVTGFYRDSETGKILPAEESGMIRIGDQVSTGFHCCFSIHPCT